MKDRITAAYKVSRNIYDTVLMQKNLLSRHYVKYFWNGTDDAQIASRLLSCIPDSFEGNLLDLPCGTAVFTKDQWKNLKHANITCMDYSDDMLAKARSALKDCPQASLMHGNASHLRFSDSTFDIIVTLNGFHAFSDKAGAFNEMCRVLKKDGLLLGCFYIRGKSHRTDWLVSNILSKKAGLHHHLRQKNRLHQFFKVLSPMQRLQ